MSIINNALSGSLAAQVALDTTSQNIANVLTPGYTRQSALMVAVPPSRSGAAAPGEGVTVPALIRFSDSYKSQNMWRAASDLGQYDTVQPYLTQMEQVMGDDNSGLSKGFDDFFAALNAASVDPTSTPLRQSILNTADSMAQRINTLNQLMSTQLVSVRQQRVSTVDQVNATAADIAALNGKIAAAQANAINASGLIDTRDKKIDALAALASVQIVEQPDGSRNVSLASGPPLVAGSMASTLKVVGNLDGTQTLKLAFAHDLFTLPGAGLGGELGGIDHYERQTLLPLKQAVTDIASQFSSAVNNQLAAGYGMAGNPGSALFVFNPAGGSSMLTIVGSVQAADLGLSSDPAKPGNSDGLLKLVDLINQAVTVTSIGSVRLGDANTQLVGKLGTASQINLASLSTAQTVRNQSEEDWKSTSGVNKDEEAVNLIQYQQMFQANMKVITVAGTLFDATLAMMG